jgi:hypothetical protein
MLEDGSRQHFWSDQDLRGEDRHWKKSDQCHFEHDYLLLPLSLGHQTISWTFPWSKQLTQECVSSLSLLLPRSTTVMFVANPPLDSVFDAVFSAFYLRLLPFPSFMNHSFYDISSFHSPNLHVYNFSTRPSKSGRTFFSVWLSHMEKSAILCTIRSVDLIADNQLSEVYQFCASWVN